MWMGVRQVLTMIKAMNRVLGVTARQLAGSPYAFVSKGTHTILHTIITDHLNGLTFQILAPSLSFHLFCPSTAAIPKNYRVSSTPALNFRG